MKRNVLIAFIVTALFAIHFSGCSGGGTPTSAGSTGTAGTGMLSSTKTNAPYNIPPAVNCSAWMSNIPAIEKATLSALTLPGTHDAGGYVYKDIIAPTPEGQDIVDGACGYVVGGPGTANTASDAARKKGRDFGTTQHTTELDVMMRTTILNHLKSGVRYLDMRVVYSVDDFYFHHGLLGDSIGIILSNVRLFMETAAGAREVVILDMSHFYENKLSYKLKIESDLYDSDQNVFLGRRVCGENISREMSTARHEQLIGLIESILGPFLYRKSGSNSDLQNVRIGDITQGGPKVIVLYPEGSYTYPDFLWSALTYNAPGDDYPNSDKLGELQSFSQSYVDTYRVSDDKRLLQVQWLLTAQPGVVSDSTKCYVLGTSCPRYNSVHDLSKIANPELGNFVYKPDQAKANIIRVDFFNETPVVDISLDSPVAVCGNVTAAANEVCVADASIDDGSSDNEGEITLTQNPPGPYPLGNTPVKLTVSDGELHSSCNAVVTVIDNTGPVIKKLKASPDVLWPPNHKMVPISIQLIVADNCDPKPACRIVQVQSNESVGQGDGAGNFEPDWVIKGDLGLELRAERSGKNDGRRYDVTVECTDKFQNSTLGTFSVEVPHSAAN